MIWKTSCFIAFAICFDFYTFAQDIKQFINKPVIDSIAVKAWTTLGFGSSGQIISYNGLYFCYLTMNRPLGSQTAILHSIKDSSTAEFVNATPLFFTSDNKELVLSVRDTIMRYKIGTGKIIKTGGVENVKYPMEAPNDWIAFQNSNKKLTVLNFFSNKAFSFSGVADFSFDDSGCQLLIKTIDTMRTDTLVALKVLDLVNSKIRDVWIGRQDTAILGAYSFNHDGKSVCFMLYNLKKSGNEIWYYDQRMENAEIKVDVNSPEIGQNLKISDVSPIFSRNSEYIFFYLQPKSSPVIKKDFVSVDVWNYRDKIIQSTQLVNPAPKLYLSVIATHGSNVVLLESDSSKMNTYPSSITGEYAITMTDVGDMFWLDEYSKSNFIKYFIVSLKDGSKVELNLKGNNDFYFSPSGKYLIYFNSNDGNNYYYSYNIKTQETINICGNLSPDILVDEDIFTEYGGAKDDLRRPAGIAGWLKDDRGVLVYDKNDIWKLDYLTGSPPLSITGDFGRKTKTKFWLLHTKEKNTGYDIPVLETKPVLLAAFNTQNYFNGFYRTSLSKGQGPHLLSMGPWTVFVNIGHLLPINLTCYDLGIEPLKARNEDVWIVKRHTATDAPNYFYTRNFKDFSRITNNQPHMNFNWLQTEKVTFAQLDGISSQGVLYKPENFDPNKKYPVIINYYQRMSERVFQYIPALLAQSTINIPWFVSRGYLIFTPDIHFTKGKIGLSAYNAVLGAANWLCKQKYVDSNKIGINGHSLGGFKTNYLITHTSKFAAALSGAGVANMIEAAFELWGPENASRLETTERRFDVPLFKDINLYLENSPILKASNVTTPLLLFHCKNDLAVPWQQSMALFTALRRLQKPVWLLQYDKGGHSLRLEKDKLDYTIRITQFFDHYLKGYPMPNWMSKGIPAIFKGSYLGYEYDKSDDLSL